MSSNFFDKLKAMIIDPKTGQLTKAGTELGAGVLKGAAAGYQTASTNRTAAANRRQAQANLDREWDLRERNSQPTPFSWARK